jgi:hypothetical protein
MVPLVYAIKTEQKPHVNFINRKTFRNGQEKYADIAIKARLNSKSRKHRTSRRLNLKK